MLRIQKGRHQATFCMWSIRDYPGVFGGIVGNCMYIDYQRFVYFCTPSLFLIIPRV